MSHRHHRGTRARDRGSIAVLVVVVVLAVTSVVLLALTALAGDLIDAGRARTAADAAALAGVLGGRPAAEAVAASNGGRVVAWSTSDTGEVITVVVTVGSATAMSRATDAP